MNPFSTSLTVASYRPRSISESPALWTVPSRASRPRSETFLRSLQVMLAGRNLWLKTPDVGREPVRSKPLLMSSTKFTSSCPEALIKLSKSHNFFLLRISAILGLSVSLSSLSLCAFSAVRLTHLLISSVLSVASWWIDLFLMYSTFCLTSFGKREMWSVGWPSLTASATNSSGEKCTPTVTCSCPSLTSLALATYPRLGVLRTRALEGSGAPQLLWTTSLNSGTNEGRCLRGWIL